MLTTILSDGTSLNKSYGPEMRVEWIADVLGVASGRALHLARAVRTTGISPEQFAAEVDKLHGPLLHGGSR